MKKNTHFLLPIALLTSPLLLANNTDISTRIVGGVQSDKDHWPWIVSVRAGIYECGGTLISSDTVLTAAHCLFDENNSPIHVNDIQVQVGEYDKNSQPATPTINITQKDVHHGYNLIDSSNDIALLRLATPVTDITPIELLDITTTDSAIANQNNVTAIGWGSTVGYSPEQIIAPNFPNILREVVIPLQTDALCTTNLGEHYQSASMLCAAPSEGGKDSCQGDSGGPLVFNESGTWKQIGVVSWGFGCASKGYPGVYTRLANYKDWIENIVSNLSIDSQISYAYTPTNRTTQESLSIKNNSNQTAQVSFTLTGSSFFSIPPETCNTIAAQASCSILIDYSPTVAEASQATLIIESDIVNSNALEVPLNAVALNDITADITQANILTSDSNIDWFTGGDASWELHTNNTILQSQTINDSEETVLMAEITGKGLLSFNWSTSSELNYDLLTLIVNGKQVNNLSGEHAFSTNGYYLDQDINTVVWRYSKDSSEKSGQDNARLTDINFNLMSEDEYAYYFDNFDNIDDIISEVINDTIDDIIDETIDEVIDEVVDSIPSSGGGGGSLLFILFAPLLLLRKYRKQS